MSFPKIDKFELFSWNEERLPNIGESCQDEDVHSLILCQFNGTFDHHIYIVVNFTNKNGITNVSLKTLENMFLNKIREIMMYPFPHNYTKFKLREY